MYSKEADDLRKELFNISFQIKQIEANHRLEGKEKIEAKKRLEELKKYQDDMRFQLRHQMYEDNTERTRGGRR